MCEQRFCLKPISIFPDCFSLSLIFPSPSSLFVFLSSQHSTLISRLELAIPSLLFSLHSSLPSHSRLVTSVRSAESDGRASQHNCAPQHGNGVAEQLNKSPPRLRVIRETNSGCSLLANKALRKAWHPRTDGILPHTAFYSILHHNRYRMAKYECTCPRVLTRRPSPHLREHAGGQGGRWKDFLGGGVHAACTESTIKIY